MVTHSLPVDGVPTPRHPKRHISGPYATIVSPRAMAASSRTDQIWSVYCSVHLSKRVGSSGRHSSGYEIQKVPQARQASSLTGHDSSWKHISNAFVLITVGNVKLK